MLSSRSLVTARTALPRAVRTTHISRASKQARLQSTSSSASSSTSNAASSSHLAAGVAGGLAALAIGYTVYSFSATGKMHSAVSKTFKETNKKYKQAAQKLQESTPDADQTVNAIKQYCYSYVVFIPGGRGVVDATFKDFETVRQNHHDEADQILNETYKQLQDASRSGLSLETVNKAFEILADFTKKVGSLAGDALTDVLDNHPGLKKQFGGSVDQLKEMGDQYGPEAKKQVDETWKQVKDVVAGGLSAANIDKARKIIEEKVEQVKKLGDEAWNKGMEQAKPLLEKNPKVKETIEKNADALKQGNAKQLFDLVKTAVESGDTSDLEGYVGKAVEKAKSKGSQIGSGLGLDQYFDMIPDGSEILTKLKSLKEVAEKHKEEGEKLLKETMDEVKQVLEKKSKKAEEIAGKAKDEAKKETK